MCGIAGIINLNLDVIPRLAHKLDVMNTVQAHRGPDGKGTWMNGKGSLGLAHRRLSIIDLTDNGSQPMVAPSGNAISYNGEIYNYLEIRKQLTGSYPFKTNSDTEVILAAYEKWGEECLQHLRGMFAFAIWDEKKQALFCARDRFGIKPFYYFNNGENLHFASEAKTLVPFLDRLDTSKDALKEYIHFQFCLGGKTLFDNIHELPPAHSMLIKGGKVVIKRYWEVYYNLDFDSPKHYFEEKVKDLLEQSLDSHLVSDVPVGSYLSGGVDSGIVSSMAARRSKSDFYSFTGKFSKGELYDESKYARALAEERGITLFEKDITSNDFLNSIHKIIYHLDFPVAGPGSFPQYHVSELAAQHRKVVLGGQGGDEIFGGYTRYLIAYFEQCIKGAIDNTLHSGNFIVTYESIIPNLVALQNYKPLLKEFWREGLFDEIDKRYFRLINRSTDMKNEIRWEALGDYHPFENFASVFNGENVKKESYFDKMTHFDFKTLLPALLQVEDRMSMAHGLESRVPFLDHPLVEFVATIPSNIKFKDGTLKMLLKDTMKHELPDMILNRKDKMGFPVPLNEWLSTDLNEFVNDTFHTQSARNRPFFNSDEILKGIGSMSKFGRKAWGLISLEIWHQEYHDKFSTFKNLLN